MGATKVERYKQTWAWEKLRDSRMARLARGLSSLRNELWAWWQCPHVVMPDVEQLAASLKFFQTQISDETTEQEEDEAPIFLLSTGWRAGSTLLQRILVTDPRLLLWGEPLGEMTIFSRIAEMLSHSISSRNLQLWKNQPDPSSSELSTSWVANLYPQGRDFRQALRQFCDQWLCEPAKQSGFTRWGFKEVRLGAIEASLLHWLYPKAKFLIISRHPYDSYRSLVDAHWGQLYYRYPDVPAGSAASFARHWNRLAVSWPHLPTGFPCVHIKYEDLIDGKVDFRKLESWLDIEIRENVALSASVGGTAKSAKLGRWERWIITQEAAPGMQVLGYSR